MSNHGGGHMLNDVLQLLYKKGYFEKVDRRKNTAFFNEILKIGYEWDCNPGEIFEEIGEELGFCYGCGKAAKKLVYGLCAACRDK